MPTFYLAGTSIIKRQALEDAIAHLNLHSEVVLVPGATSSVNEQPVGHVEVRIGARNRAMTAWQIMSKPGIYIGIENAIDLNPFNEWVNYACVVAIKPIPRYRAEMMFSGRVTFPTEAVEVTRSKEGGFALNTVGKTLKEMGLVASHDDPHLSLAGVSRRTLLKEAIVDLLRGFDGLMDEESVL